MAGNPWALEPPGIVPHLEMAADLVEIGVRAADMEVLGNPYPVSSVRHPDGGPQAETQAERTRRIVSTAVMHLIELGLLVIPDDIGGKLEKGIPVSRKLHQQEQ